MIEMFGIPNCDGCRAARRWMKAQDLPFEERDLRADPPTVQELGRWLDAAGAALMNKRSTTWRGLDESERQRATVEPASLLREHPTLIKRPVLVLSDEVLVGFDERRWKQALGL